MARVKRSFQPAIHFLRAAPAAMLALYLATSVAASTVGVLPFKDKSGFKSKWKLGRGMQKYLSDYLAEYVGSRGVDTINTFLKKHKLRYSNYLKQSNLTKMANELKLSYIVTAKIEKFYVIKKMAGTGQLGGYKHYNAGVKLKVTIFDADNNELLNPFPVEVNDKDFGLKINPPAKLSKDEENFHKMERQAFGSKAFKSTIAGKVMDEVCNRIYEKMHFTKRETGPRKVRKAFDAKVLSVEDSIVYVNVGSDDSIGIGDIFSVFSDGAPLLDPESGDTLGFTDKESGEIVIDFIKARHLSSAKIKKGKGQIQPRDRVRVKIY